MLLSYTKLHKQKVWYYHDKEPFKISSFFSTPRQEEEEVVGERVWRFEVFEDLHAFRFPGKKEDAKIEYKLNRKSSCMVVVRAWDLKLKSGRAGYSTGLRYVAGERQKPEKVKTCSTPTDKVALKQTYYIASFHKERWRKREWRNGTNQKKTWDWFNCILFYGFFLFFSSFLRVM